MGVYAELEIQQLEDEAYRLFDAAVDKLPTGILLLFSLNLAFN